VPKIQFDNLPREITRHLIDRIRKRKISAADLERVRRWVHTEPEVPDGDWYKNFGSFKLCDTGAYPKTVLTEATRPYGEEIE
jgi:hypothetical protein